MNELMLLLGKALPYERLIEEIKEKSTEYLLTKSEETKGQLEMYCMLLLSKKATEGKDVMEMAKEMEEVGRIRERMNSEKA